MLSLKHIIASLILVLFLTVTLWSFGAMMHGVNGDMLGGCPFSAGGVSICPQNTLAVVIHHISAYNSFLNVSASSGIIALLVLILALSAVLAFSISPPSLLLSVPAQSSYRSPSATSYERKVTYWLSLFEHSPSHL